MNIVKGTCHSYDSNNTSEKVAYIEANDFPVISCAQGTLCKCTHCYECKYSTNIADNMRQSPFEPKVSWE